MINLEESIDKLKLNDQIPVDINFKSTVINKQTQDEQLDKSIDKNLNLELKDKKISIESKDNSTSSNKINQEVVVPNKSNETVVAVSVKPQQQQQQKSNQQPPPQQQSQHQQSINIQQQSINLIKSQSSSTTAKQQQKKLEGGQSKSASKNISYEVDFLKELQFTNLSTARPNFNNLNGKVEIFLTEPRKKNDVNEFELSFEPSFMRQTVSCISFFLKISS